MQILNIKHFSIFDKKLEKCLYISLILLLLFLANCKPPEEEPTSYNFETKGVFITNEGNFTYGNSSLSYLHLAEKKIYNNVFFNATGFPLGDVAQSVTIWEDYVFITINNSGKIYIINKNTFEYVAIITGLTSPRYIQIINSEKAYISDLYSKEITIFNPTTFEITGTINLNATSEKMILWNNFVFVTNWSFGNKLFKINTETNSVTDSLFIAYQPNSLVLDKNNKLWILSDASTYIDSIPKLLIVNPKNMQVENVFEFKNSESSPSHLSINKTKDTIYFLNNSWAGTTNNGGVFAMSINSVSIPETPIIKQTNQLFYSMSVSDKSIIYLTDAIDFSQNGILYRYKTNGALLDTFLVGIIPGNFAFKN